MRARTLATILATMLASGIPATMLAQQPPAEVEVGAALIALALVPAKSGAKLTVSSPAFKAGGDIPFENTQYRANVFPGLAWSAGPAGTKSYAVIMQDGDGVRNGNPFLHWTMINVPSTITKLDAGMTAQPAGAAYGPNYRGQNQPYLGPRTPAGPKHRYHFQIFALDVVLPADAAASLDAIKAAMTDHVLASGELVALGQVAPPSSPD